MDYVENEVFQDARLLMQWEINTTSLVCCNRNTNTVVWETRKKVLGNKFHSAIFLLVQLATKIITPEEII